MFHICNLIIFVLCMQEIKAMQAQMDAIQQDSSLTDNARAAQKMPLQTKMYVHIGKAKVKEVVERTAKMVAAGTLALYLGSVSPLLMHLCRCCGSSRHKGCNSEQCRTSAGAFMSVFERWPLCHVTLAHTLAKVELEPQARLWLSNSASACNKTHHRCSC